MVDERSVTVTGREGNSVAFYARTALQRSPAGNYDDNILGSRRAHLGAVEMADLTQVFRETSCDWHSADEIIV